MASAQPDQAEADRVHARAVRYFDTAAERVLEDLAAAGSGGRNNALNDAVHRLAALHAALARHNVHVDDADQLYRRALQAANANGSLSKRGGGARQFRATFISAWRGGHKHAARLPAELAADLERVRFPSSRPPAATPAATAAELGDDLPPLDLAELQDLEQPDECGWPDLGEVQALWDQCVRVDADAEVCEWLSARRGLDPVTVADRDLARALPASASVPPWARCSDGYWPASGHRLIVPLVDAQGAMRSVIGRRVRDARENENASLKSAGTLGSGSRTGLLMACDLARQVLEAAALPEWMHGGAPLRVVVLEGEMDWCACRAQLGDSDASTAVIGHTAGFRPQQVLERIPDGAIVHVRVHIDTPDPRTGIGAGEAKATKIVRAMAERWRAGRLVLELDPRCTIDAGLTVRAKSNEG